MSSGREEQSSGRVSYVAPQTTNNPGSAFHDLWPRNRRWPSFHGSNGGPSTITRTARLHWQGGSANNKWPGKVLSFLIRPETSHHQETKCGDGWVALAKGNPPQAAWSQKPLVPMSLRLPSLAQRHWGPGMKKPRLFPQVQGPVGVPAVSDVVNRPK